VPISSIPGFPTVEALGLYPTWQTLLAQMVLLALFVFAVAKTFWPKRSVALPTVTAETPVSDNLVSQLERMRADNETLAARIEALEAEREQRHAPRVRANRE
jgi:maltodextrin utilization protein YvdJ